MATVAAAQPSAALLQALRHYVSVRAEYDIAAEAHLEAAAAAQHSALCEQLADRHLAACETRESAAFETLAKALQNFDARNLGIDTTGACVGHGIGLQPIDERLANDMANCARDAERKRARHLTLVTEATVSSLPGLA